MGGLLFIILLALVELKQFRFLRHDNSAAYLLDKDGESPLHIAPFQGLVNVVDELVRFCPDAWDIINSKGETALHAAVIGGRVNVVNYI